MVIPAMDHIDQVLSSQSIDKVKFDAPIRVAIAMGKKTLNRYYTLTDLSEVYRIAMSKTLSFLSPPITHFTNLFHSSSPYAQACLLQESRLGT